MAEILTGEIKRFSEDGFAAVRTTLGSDLAVLRGRFLEVFSSAAMLSGIGAIETDADLIALYGDHKQVWDAGYHQLKYLPETLRLAASEDLVALARALGIGFPALCGFPVTRVDMPGDEVNILGAHQDYPYHRGSNGSVTLWIALQDTEAELGPVDVVRASHLPGEIDSIRGAIVDPETLAAYEFSSCRVERGEVLAMSQMLVHRSGRNRSNKVRFSLQVRFNDLDDAEYAGRSFFVNECSTQGFVARVE